jgi:oligopeptide/dipeptide ABC transporter ATP-binding protein
MESLNPVLRVGSQVAEPLIVHLKMKKDEANVEVARLFELVMLPRDVFNRYPHELSGGMKQRVVIAMALALHPDLVILDEPTSALDVSVQAQIMNLLKRLKWELGISFLFITHDIALASDLSDAIAVMYGGQILEIGSSEQILTKPVHPYTRLLLGSVPRLNSSIQPQFIPGMHPDMSTPLHGCRFISRCPYAYQRCRVESPNLFEVDSGQLGRCWLLEETSGNIEFAES